MGFKAWVWVTRINQVFNTAAILIVITLIAVTDVTLSGNFTNVLIGFLAWVRITWVYQIRNTLAIFVVITRIAGTRI